MFEVLSADNALLSETVQRDRNLIACICCSQTPLEKMTFSSII